MRRYRRSVLVVALALATASGMAGRACAQTSGPAPGSFDDVLHALQLKGTVTPAPAFVQQSRPKVAQPFIPVGTSHPDRSVRLLTPAELAATESELDTARARQQRRAGQVPATVPTKAQAKAKTAKIIPR